MLECLQLGRHVHRVLAADVHLGDQCLEVIKGHPGLLRLAPLIGQARCHFVQVGVQAHYGHLGQGYAFEVPQHGRPCRRHRNHDGNLYQQQVRVERRLVGVVELHALAKAPSGIGVQGFDVVQ